MTKTICFLIIISSILFTPFQFYFNHIKTSFSVALFSFILISSLIFYIGWMGLLKTNNPTTRYNPFSVNKNWKESYQDAAINHISQLDEPTEEDKREYKKKSRQKKLGKLLDD